MGTKLKKVFLGIFVLIIVILTTLFYVSKDGTYIENQVWKYAEGNHIGDVLDFKNEYLKENHIYRNEEIIAKIVFCTKKKLIIKNPKNGDKGYYFKIEIE